MRRNRGSEVFITEIYCDNGDCNVRTSEVLTKNLGDNPEPASWRCPGCGMRCRVHWRRTFHEQAQHELRLAVSRVNAALYAREQPEFPALPLDVMLVHTLPDMWRCQEKKPAK